MTPRDFCYWLQGLFEIGEPSELTPRQVEIIQNHLNMVFIHEAPAAATPKPTATKVRHGDAPPGFEALC